MARSPPQSCKSSPAISCAGNGPGSWPLPPAIEQDTDRSAVGFEQLLCDRQAHATAIFFSRKQRLENAVGDFRRDSGTVVGEGQFAVSRWEAEAQMQQREIERFLRVCLASPAVVELPRSDFQLSSLFRHQRGPLLSSSVKGSIVNAGA